MRDLINLIQFISESTGFGNLMPSSFKNKPERFATFIDKIKSKDPFTTIDDKEVVIDPIEASRFISIWDTKTISFINASAETAKLANKSTYNGKNIISLSKLKKTTEFGGHGVRVGADPTTGGKASFALNPHQIGICDKPIPAHSLYDVLSNNTVLNSTDYGKIVLDLINCIVSGESVSLPKEAYSNEKLRAAIQDNAGEYLGILALLYDRSRFPRRDQFEEWLGASLGELVLNFPSSETTPLADSYAEIKNSKTHHTVNISSKGYKGGAAPAISGLKIPDHLRTNPKLKNGIAFVEMCQHQSVLDQTFSAIDLLYKSNKKTIDDRWKPFLPFSAHPELKQQIIANLRGKGGSLSPAFKKIVASVASKKATEGGKVIYALKNEIQDAINHRNALPEFKDMVLELLEMNFVQQYVDYEKKNQYELTFATQWPAKLDGVITVEHKSSANEPGSGGFSFKLGRTDSDLGDEPDEELVGDTEDEEDFVDKAQAVTTAKKTPAKRQPEIPVGNVGRDKRRT